MNIEIKKKMSDYIATSECGTGFTIETMKFDYDNIRYRLHKKTSRYVSQRQSIGVGDVIVSDSGRFVKVVYERS